MFDQTGSYKHSIGICCSPDYNEGSCALIDKNNKNICSQKAREDKNSKNNKDILSKDNLNY